MYFSILGPLEILDDAGRRVPPVVGRPSRLLTGLLLRANRRVPVADLVDLLWPSRPPRSHLANMQSHVSKLRGQLAPVPIERDNGGYTLVVPPSAVDVVEFVSRTEAGRAALSEGRTDEARTCFLRATTMFRDLPLSDADAGPFAPDIARLAEVRQLALDGLTETDLATGRYQDAVVRLRQLTTEFPLREVLWSQLMTALAAQWHTAEALDVFQLIRATLRNELGVEPGPRLQRVYHAVLRNEDARTVPVAQWRTGTCQLPAQATDFTGREQLTDDLLRLLRANTRTNPAVVVISGAPGVGKSALAVRLGHALRDAFPDGQLFTELTGTSSHARKPGDVLLELLRSVGTSAVAVPDNEPERSAAWRGQLADRRVLLVLDDAWSADQVVPLLPGTSGCATIVTSRRRLTGVPGSRLVLLDPLTDDEALTMLGSMVGEHRIAAETEQAQQLRSYTGNLPLALRVVGARVAARPERCLGSLVVRLADERRRLDELALGDLEVRSSVMLSYEALDEDARRAWRMLGMLGPRDVPSCALALLLDVDVDVADRVADQLVEANLLEPVASPTGAPRYRMHDMLRDFGAERTACEDTRASRNEALRRLVAAAAGVAALADSYLPQSAYVPAPPELRPSGALLPWLERAVRTDPSGWLRAEQENLVDACLLAAGRGWLDLAVGLASRLHAHLWNDGHHDELAAIYQAVHDAATAVKDEPLLAWASYMNARTASLRGAVTDAVSGFLEIRREALRLGLVQLYGYALASLCFYLADAHDGDARAVRYGRAAVRVFRALGDRRGEVDALRATALALNTPYSAGEALVLLEEAVEAGEQMADSLVQALLLNARASVRYTAGDAAAAAADCNQAISLLRGIGERSALSYVYSQLGYFELAQDHVNEALTAFSAALDIVVAIDDRMMVAAMERNIALALCRSGYHRQALQIVQGAARTLRDLADAPRLALTLRLLADLHESTGSPDAAAACVAEADTLLPPADTLSAERLRLLRKLVHG